MKKNILLIFVLFIMIISCGKQSETNQTSSQNETGKKVIGFSQATLGSPFYVSLMDSAKVTAEELGFELKYLDAQEDIIKQNKDILDLLNTGVSVLILNPVEAEGVRPSIEEAKKRNIPIVTVDRPVSQEVNSFIGRDNRNMGLLIGEKAVELLGGKGNAKGKILEIQGSAGDRVMMERRDGFHDAVDKEPGITVVQSPYCSYVRANAMKATQDLIQGNPDVNLIYGYNDDMALGALQIFEQNGKNVYVVGIDGLMEAVKAIDDGKYHATTMNDPSLLGRLAVETAAKILNGEEVEKNIDAGTMLITKENASTYYDSTKTFAEN